MALHVQVVVQGICMCTCMHARMHAMSGGGTIPVSIHEYMYDICRQDLVVVQGMHACTCTQCMHTISGDGDARWWCTVVVHGGGVRWWCKVVVQGGGASDDNSDVASGDAWVCKLMGHDDVVATPRACSLCSVTCMSRMYVRVWVYT